MRRTRAPPGQRQLGGAVGGAVDDENLADRAGVLEALATPGHEVGDGELLVDRRDHDGDLGILDVVRGAQQLHIGVFRPGDRGR